MKSLRYLARVTTLQFDPELCIGCGMCAVVCPHGVFEVTQGKARLLDRDGCMECGACSRNCPVTALTVRAGVGCASAIIHGWLTGTPPSCDCGGGESCC